MSEFILISALGFVMGIVSAISGGSGVFAVPTMLAFGIPPINVLALNRMSDVGVVFGALKSYAQSKNIDWKLAFIIMIPLAIGSYAGATLILKVPPSWLNPIIIGGVLIGIFFLLKPVQSRTAALQKTLSKTGLLLLLLVGLWSGGLAMAGATFAVIVLVHFFHKDFLQARSTDIAAAIPETLIATIVLYRGSTVAMGALVAMFISSFIGAWIGSHLAVRHGSELIRKAMIGIAIVMIVKVVLKL